MLAANNIDMVLKYVFKTSNWQGLFTAAAAAFGKPNPNVFAIPLFFLFLFDDEEQWRKFG